MSHMSFRNSHTLYDFTHLTPRVQNWVDTQIARFDQKKRSIPCEKNIYLLTGRQSHILIYGYYSVNISFPPYTKDHLE